MNKLFLTAFILITVTLTSYGQVSVSDSLSQIESSIYGYEYKNESDNVRIERLETAIYGEARNGNLNKRIEDIKNDTGLIVLNKKETKKLKEEQKNNNKNDELKDIITVKEDSTVEYPMVDKIEQEIFKTTYKMDDIYERLNRLETKVFNSTSTEDLNTRVDKLAAVVRPKNYKPSVEKYSYTPQELDAYYSMQDNLEPINNQSMPFQLSALEQDLLKHDYMNDNNADRLSRLEQKLFNRTFKTDTDVTRLQRVMVAYDAKRNSYKYENNKRMQNMATVSQIGGLLLMILAILL